MKHDQRKHNRFKINQMCEVYMGREVYIPVHGIDISEGGLSFKTEESLAINSLMEFQLALYFEKKTRTINCQGVVRRFEADEEDYTGAIEFSNLSDENKKIIHEFIKTM